ANPADLRGLAPEQHGLRGVVPRRPRAGGGHTSRMATSNPPRELRILHLEDSELDHELTLAHLARGGLRCMARRVDSEGEFLAALAEDWDAIISDYNLPGFSGLVALDLL